GRVSGHGTAGDPMIRGIRQVWPEFSGSRVNLQEAIGLLQEGRLLVFLSKGCQGWNAPPALDRRNRWTPEPPPVSYPGHYMVLAGVEGPPGNELFYVVDPGRNARRMMRFISRRQLQSPHQGIWWVYRVGEPETRL